MTIPTPPADPGELLSPMLRFLWQEARDQIHEALATAGYSDVRAEHLAVLQHPGPDGERPSALAARSAMSRQAINHLLRQLEAGGYLERLPDAQNRGARVIRLLPKGEALIAHIKSAAGDLEQQWTQDLGSERFTQLRASVAELCALRQASGRG